MAILDVDDLNFKNSLSLKNIKGTVTQLLNLTWKNHYAIKLSIPIQTQPW